MEKLKQHSHHITELVLRCQLGDMSAWKQLIDDMHKRLWRYISHMLNNQQNSEDVLQEVWIKVFKSLIKLNEPSKFTNWIFQIARRTVVDHLRAQYRQPQVFNHECNELVDESTETPLDQDFESIKSGLKSLHPTLREIVILYYLREQSTKDIALICDIPVGTVKSRLFQSRQLLKTFLQANS